MTWLLIVAVYFPNGEAFRLAPFPPLPSLEACQEVREGYLSEFVIGLDKRPDITAGARVEGSCVPQIHGST